MKRYSDYDNFAWLYNQEWAFFSQNIVRAPSKTPLRQRIERTKELKRQGLSNGQISKILGVSKATIKNYLEDYPYKKD